MQPTLCASLRTGTIITAAIDTILALLATCFSLILVFNYVPISDDYVLVDADLASLPKACLQRFLNVAKLTPVGSTAIRVFLYANCIYWVQKIGLGFALLYGSVREVKNAIRIWLFYTVMLLILSILFFLAAILLQILKWITIPIYIVAVIVREYIFWIVSTYLASIGSHNKELSPGHLQHIDDDLTSTDATLQDETHIA